MHIYKPPTPNSKKLTTVAAAAVLAAGLASCGQEQPSAKDPEVKVIIIPMPTSPKEGKTSKSEGVMLHEGDKLTRIPVFTPKPGTKQSVTYTAKTAYGAEDLVAITSKTLSDKILDYTHDPIKKDSVALLLTTTDDGIGVEESYVYYDGKTKEVIGIEPLDYTLDNLAGRQAITPFSKADLGYNLGATTDQTGKTTAVTLDTLATPAKIPTQPPAQPAQAAISGQPA